MVTYCQEGQARITWKGSRYKSVPAKGETRHQKTDPHISAGGNPVQQAVSGNRGNRQQTSSQVGRGGRE